MKRLLFTSILAILFLVNNIAQESAYEDTHLNYGKTWFSYISTSNATTATDSIWYYTTRKESMKPLKYDIKIVLDSIGGTAVSVPVVLQAKKFLSDSFTPLDTITWADGGDTTIVWNETSTAQQYRYWRVYIQCATSGFIFGVDELSQKFWE